MALINPCENCQIPHLLKRVSDEIEGTLPKFREDEAQRIELLQSGRGPKSLRNMLMGRLANTAAFLADVQALSERANAKPCDPNEESCSRALFVMGTFSAAMDNALAGIEQARVADPLPEPPSQPPPSE